jgi:hypothetical protein
VHLGELARVGFAVGLQRVGGLLVLDFQSVRSTAEPRRMLAAFQRDEVSVAWSDAIRGSVKTLPGTD